VGLLQGLDGTWHGLAMGAALADRDQLSADCQDQAEHTDDADYGPSEADVVDNEHCKADGQ
jgi:hypothetical protein